MTLRNIHTGQLALDDPIMVAFRISLLGGHRQARRSAPATLLFTDATALTGPISVSPRSLLRANLPQASAQPTMHRVSIHSWVPKHGDCERRQADRKAETEHTVA